MTVLTVYMIWQAYDDTISYEEITSSDIPHTFDGYTIFFIADIHRRTIKVSTLEKVISPVNAICIGGDLLERGVSFGKMRKNIQILKRWNVPIYFVWGNNDYETNAKRVKKILLEENVVILQDSVHTIIRGTDHMNLLGFDFHYGNHAQSLLNWDLVDQAYTILLCHKPSAYNLLSKKYKDQIDLVLAGHTHGGQIRVLDFGPYEKGGLQRVGKTDVLVTEGYGYTFLPFRLGTYSECHLITLKHLKGKFF